MGIKSFILKHRISRMMVDRGIKKIPQCSGFVLMYHDVLPDSISLPAWTIVRASEFEWQMRFLSSHFDVLSMDDALERINNRQKSSKPFAVVTFDDGYQGVLHSALPVMDHLNLPFVVYVATQAILEHDLFWYDKIIHLLGEDQDIKLLLDRKEDKPTHFKLLRRGSDQKRWKEMQRLLECLKKMTPADRNLVVAEILTHAKKPPTIYKMLNMDELHCLSSSRKVTIGAHTHGHELLDQVDQLQIKKTIIQSNEHIHNITGQTPKHFAYPNGNYDQNVLEQIKSCGYETAVITRPGLWSADNDSFQIPRIGIGRFETRSSFMARLSGWI